MRQSTGYGAALVLSAALLWGTTGTAAALAPAVGPLVVGAAAMGLGGLLQAAVAGRAMITSRVRLIAHWQLLSVAAVATAIYPLAFYTSMRWSGVAVGTVVSIGSAPVAAALIERIGEGRRLSRRWMLGAATGVVGLVALTIGHVGGEQQAGAQQGWRSVAGIALGLLAGLSYAGYSWAAAQVMRRGVPARPVMGTIFGLGGLLLAPIIVLAGSPIIESVRNLAVVGYLAVVPMFLGYLLFGRGLACLSASTATALSLVEPAAATVIAMLVLHERLAGIGWLGLVLVLGSMIVLTVNPPRGLTRLASGPMSEKADATPA